jgi:integrase
MPGSVLTKVIERSTRLGDKTKEVYLLCVERFVEFAGEDQAAWNGVIVEEWRDHLCLNLQPVTVNKHLYALRYASSRLEGLGIGVDFARAAESVPSPKTRSRSAMTVVEVRALVATCDQNRPDDLRDRAAITLALMTGLRASNLVGLTWGGIKGRIAECIIKGNKLHRVVLDDRCLRELGAWAAWLESTGKSVTRGPIWREVREQLDGSHAAGRSIRNRLWLNRMLNSRAAEAGLTGIYPHRFRHTFVSWALEAGVPPQRVMRQTGHSNMATLSQYVTDLEAELNPIGDHLPDF